MKKLILFSLAAMAALSASAQTEPATAAAVPTPVVVQQQQPQLRFGYVSCDSALHALPEYAVAMRNLKDLRAKYDAEMKRVEDEFNSKYELFLEGQKDFAPSIRQKRQAELQELMEKNMAFKKEAQQLLGKAEKDAITPLKKTIQATITRIGQQKGLAFVVNTDGESMPYLNTTMGIDITEEVIRASK
jgi:outer membrane protein